MAIFISYCISTRDTHISTKAEGRRPVGWYGYLGLIWVMIWKFPNNNLYLSHMWTAKSLVLFVCLFVCVSTKECCRPRWGLNPRPPGLQLDGASNWATETACINITSGNLVTDNQMACQNNSYGILRPGFHDIRYFDNVYNVSYQRTMPPTFLVEDFFFNLYYRCNQNHDIWKSTHGRTATKTKKNT